MYTQTLQRYIDVAGESADSGKLSAAKRALRIRWINRAYGRILNRNDFQD